MYIVKNAWRNIIRSKTRNILLGIIICIIGIVSTIALAIKNTARDLINSYEEAYEAEATITFNRTEMKRENDMNEEGMENMKEIMSNLSSITIDEVIDYGDSKYLKNYYYTYSIGLSESDDLEKASSDFSFGKGRGTDTSNDKNIPSDNFTLVGYSSLNSMQNFIEGTYSITESIYDAWDYIFDGNYVFINDELASLNEVSVGDEIHLTYNDESYAFIVAAIYEESSNDSQMSMFSNSANTIITNVDVVASIVEDNEDITATVKPTFILNSFNDLEDFQNELYEKGLSEYYTLSTNEEEVSSATSSVSNVCKFSNTFLILTLLIGVIILFIINQINIRERKYEIGVLRTIGMKKITLTLQFAIELLIVTIMSLIIGFGVGALLAKPVSNMILENEINSSQTQKENIEFNFGGSMNDKGGIINNMKGVVNVQAYDSINAVVDYKVILELFAIGILLTIISSISSMISIQRFSPLQILKERS